MPYRSPTALAQGRPPDEFAELRLALAACIFLVAAGLFGIIAADVLNHGPLSTSVDVQVVEWLHARATPLLTLAMVLVSYSGAPGTVLGIASMMGLILLRYRLRYRFLALFFAVPVGMLLNVLIKHAVGRHRPIFDDLVLTIATHSFPSGHSFAATVLYGTLAIFAVWTVPDRRLRVAAVIASALFIVLIGFSRVYLGVHYLSDVLGGVAEGVAWLAVCLTAVDALRRRRAGR